MKRRNFLTTAALGAAAAVVAPKVFSQDPYVEYAKMERELLDWYIAPRGNVHVKENNYWHLLQGNSEWGYKSAIEESMVDHRHNTRASLKGTNHSGYSILPWNDGGLLHVMDQICLRDYSNVYERMIPIPIGGQFFYSRMWMNVEDYEFYRHWMTGKFPLRTGERYLMGVELVPGPVDPFRPTQRFYKTPELSIDERGNIRRSYPVDSYEIHVMWRKR